jgi:hypothetical protein
MMRELSSSRIDHPVSKFIEFDEPGSLRLAESLKRKQELQQSLNR